MQSTPPSWLRALPRINPASRCVGALTLLVLLAGCSSGADQAVPAPEAPPSAPPPASSPAPEATTATPEPSPPAPPATTAKPKPEPTKPEPTKSRPAEPKGPSAPVDQPAPGAKVDCGRVKCIALTFDDGPAKDTPKVLRALTEEKAVATFFLQGPSLKAYPAIAKQIADTPGMEIGNHTATHAQGLPGASPDRLKREISGNHDRIKQITGRDSTVFRPPFGARNAKLDKAAAAAGESVVMWDVDTEDWRVRNGAKVRETIRKQARPGSIVLLHDIHSSTVKAVPDIVRDLKGQGYTLVTVSQLMGGSTTPGKVYTSRG